MEDKGLKGKAPSGCFGELSPLPVDQSMQTRHQALAGWRGSLSWFRVSLLVSNLCWSPWAMEGRGTSWKPSSWLG